MFVYAILRFAYQLDQVNSANLLWMLQSLDNILGRSFFCRGDEKWIRKISFFCGEEKKEREKY